MKMEKGIKGSLGDESGSHSREEKKPTDSVLPSSSTSGDSNHVKDNSHHFRPLRISGLRSLPVSAASSRDCSPRSTVSEAPSLATQAMARLAQSRAGTRTFIPDTNAKKSLTTGDVVVLRTKGAFLAATSFSQIGANADASIYTLAPSDIMDPSDRTLHFEVLRQGAWIGLRSSITGDRLLQARRKGPQRIAFFSANLGTWEQWEVMEMSQIEREAWNKANVTLRNRRMPTCELNVQMIRVGRCILAPEASVTPRSLPSALPALDEFEDQTENINIRHMSGLLFHEWSSFVEREKRIRESIQNRAEQAIQDACGLRHWATDQLANARHDIETEVDVLLNALRDKSEALEDAKLRLTTRLKWGASLLEAKKSAVLARRILAVWRAVVAQHQYNRNVVAKLRERSSLRTRSMVLVAWLQLCEMKRMRQAKLRAAVRRMSLLKMHNVFSIWRIDVEQKLRAAAAEEDVVMALNSRLMSKRMRWIFNGWRIRAQRVSEAQLLLSSISFRYCQRLTEMAFSAWNQRSKKIGADVEELMRRNKQSYLQRQMALSLRAWRLFVDDEVGIMMQLHHAKVVLSRRCLNRAIVAWQIYVIEEKESNQLWKKACKIKNSNLMFLSMAIWRGFARKQIVNRRNLVSFVNARADRQMQLSFQLWRAHQQQQRHVLSVTQYSEEENAYKIKFSVLTTWLKWLKQSKIERHRIEMCRKKHDERLLWRILHAWKELASDSIREKGLLDKFESRVVRSRLLFCMNVLRSNAALSIHERCITSKAEAWYAGRLQARALWALEEAIVRHHSFTNSLVQISKQRDLQLLKDKWETWLQVTGEAKATEMMVERFQSRRLWYIMKSAFRRWNSAVETSLLLKSIQKNCTSRMKVSRKRWLLDVWRHTTRDIVSEKLMEAHLCRRLHRIRLNLFFSHWRTYLQYVLEIKERIEYQKYTDSEEVARIALGSWRKNAHIARLQNQFRLNTLEKRAHGLRSLAFSAWVKFYRYKSFNASVLKKARRRISIVKLKNAIANWRLVTEDAIGMRLRLGAIGMTLVLKHDELVAKRVFSSWRSKVTEVKTALACMDMRKNCRLSTSLPIIFNCWRSQAAVSKSLQARAIHSLVDRRASRLQTLGFKAWRLEATISARNEIVILHRGERIMLRAGRRTFETWRAAVRDHKSRRTAIMRFLQRISQARTASAFSAWRSLAAERAAAQEELRKCLIRKRVSFRIFRQWYWDSFDSDLQATLRAMFEMDDEFAYGGFSGASSVLASPIKSDLQAKDDGKSNQLIPYRSILNGNQTNYNQIGEASDNFNDLRSRIREAIAEANDSPALVKRSKYKTTELKSSHSSSLFGPLASLYNYPGEFKIEASHDSEEHLSSDSDTCDKDGWLREKNKADFMHGDFPPLSPVMEADEKCSPVLYKDRNSIRSFLNGKREIQCEYTGVDSLRLTKSVESNTEALTVGGISSLPPASDSIPSSLLF